MLNWFIEIQRVVYQSLAPKVCQRKRWWPIPLLWVHLIYNWIELNSSCESVRLVWFDVMNGWCVQTNVSYICHKKRKFHSLLRIHCHLSLSGVSSLCSKPQLTQAFYIHVLRGEYYMVQSKTQTQHFTQYSTIRKKPLERLRIAIEYHFTYSYLFPTQRQLNAEQFIVSPDLNYVALIADIDQDGSR